MADKYYRLVSFVVNICPQPLRELFLKYMYADPTRAPTCTTLDAYLASRKHQLQVLQKRNLIRQDHLQLLFPTQGQVDELSWDTTLLIVLLEGFFKRQLQKQEVYAFQNIRGIRNRLQHMAETSIADADFDGMWNILEKATIDLAKQIQPSPAYEDKIKEEIDDTKVNNMPKLGDSLRYWYEHIIMQLKLEIEDMKEIMMEISEQTADNLRYSRDCQTILQESSVKKVGPSGDKVKRMKTVDQILAKLNNYFITTMKEDLPTSFDRPPEVADIKTKLRDVHHVVVTGYRGSRYLETALAAIHDMDYNHSRCVEMRGSSDWRHIDPEEVDLVLCREPFGDYTFDEKRTKSMADIFNNMLRTASASDGSKHLDIVIVSETDVLQHVSNVHEHDLLEEVVKVYQPTTEKDPADLTNTYMELEGDVSTCTENLLGFTAAFVERYKDETFHSKTVVNEAKAELKRNKVIVLTGPRKCGKTTLAVTLASKYQRNQFLVLNKPDDLKHVSLNSICMVLVEDFAGKHLYDVASTCAWLKEFEMLYSAVCTGKLNVIITCEETMLLRCQKEFGQHTILQNTVKLKCVDRIVKQEAADENESCDMVSSSRYGNTDPSHLEASSDENSQESEKSSRKVHSSDAFISIKDMSSLNENTILCLSSSATVLRLNSNLDVEGTYEIQEQNAERVCRMNDEKFLINSDNELSVYELKQDKIQPLRKETLDHECDCITAGKDGTISILNDNHIFEYDEDLILTEKKRLPMKSIKDNFVIGIALLCDSKCLVILKQDSIKVVMYKSKTPVKRCLYLAEKRLQPFTVCSGKDDMFILCLQDDGQTKILRLGFNLEKRGQLKLPDVPYTSYNITSMIFDSQKFRLLVTYCGKLDELACHQLTSIEDRKCERNQLTTVFTRVKKATSNILDNVGDDYMYMQNRICQHPDGSFLVLQYGYADDDADDDVYDYDDLTLVIHHFSSDFQYIRKYNTDIPYKPDNGNFDICCTDSGDVVIDAVGEVTLYRITDGTIQNIKSNSSAHGRVLTGSLCFFMNRIYMFCGYYGSALVMLDTNLNVKKQVKLYLDLINDPNHFPKVVPCVMQKYLHIYHKTDSIICDDPKKKQIKYLHKEGFEPHSICAASEDSVFVVGRQGFDDRRILQVNTDMEILSDITLKGKGKGKYWLSPPGRMVFDKVNARLILFTGCRKIDQMYLE